MTSVHRHKADVSSSGDVRTAAPPLMLKELREATIDLRRAVVAIRC